MKEPLKHFPNLYTSYQIRSLAKDAYSQISRGQLEEFCTLNCIPLDNRLKVLMVISAHAGGVGYYRVYQPAEFINRYYSDEAVALSTEVVTPELVYGWADVIVVSRVNHPEWYMFAKRTKAAVVYECDDLIHDLDESNPAHRDWNKEDYRYWWSMEIVKACPYLQTSTEQLASYYRQGHQRTAVLPNAVDPEKFPAFDPDGRPQHPGIRLGWQGSVTHLRDLQLVSDTLRQILKEYPEAQLHTMGWNGVYFSNKTGARVDAFQGLPRRSTDYEVIRTGKYYPKLFDQQYDIAFAPLVDTPFNRCKSNVKLLEYALCGFPVVASAVTPYTGTLEHGHDGLLAANPDEWYRAFKTLLDDPGYARQMAVELREKVLADYNMHNIVHQYMEFYKTL